MIIGFVAPKGSGKTTACHIVRQLWDADAQLHNFKDALVYELKVNMPDVIKQLADVYYPDKRLVDAVDLLFKEKPPAMRALMQNYGTNLRRKENSRYWIKQWRERLPTGNVLVDDVRFLNEADAVRTNGGILIRIHRTDIENTDEHQSEQEQKLIVCDYVIRVGKDEINILTQELAKILKTLPV